MRSQLHTLKIYSFYSVICFCFIVVLCVMPAYAATNAPHTGLEGGQRHSYGPDTEGRQQQQIKAGQGMVDAYGNPIVPEEEKAPKSRLRSGAYGGPAKQLDERPLPDLPETNAGWNF